MSRTSEILCAETRALLTRLLDGELAGDERAKVERHIERCEPCAAELRSAERAFSALRGLPADDRARVRDEALRELGVDGDPHGDAPWFPSRRSRVIRFVLMLVAFALLFFVLKNRRENATPDVPRGVETR